MKYKKISYLFESVGAWLQIIYSIFYFIAIFPVKIFHELKIVNKLFNYNIKNITSIPSNSFNNLRNNLIEINNKNNLNYNINLKKCKSKISNSNNNSKILLLNKYNFNINTNKDNLKNKNLKILHNFSFNKNNNIVNNNNCNFLQKFVIPFYSKKVKLNWYEIYFFICFQNKKRENIFLFKQGTNFYKDKIDALYLFNFIYSIENIINTNFEQINK